MYWYSVGDFLVDTHLFFEWINYIVWSIYDPITNSHISPCAVKEDCIGIDLRSTPGLTGSCLLTPDYCAITQMCTIAFCSFFCVFGVAGVCLLCCYFSEKTRLRQKEKNSITMSDAHVSSRPFHVKKKIKITIFSVP